METIRVLHVDDEPNFGDLVSDFLEMEDEAMEVVTETSAQDGVSRIESDRERIDCVISDYDMPGMDGLAFLDAIRDDHPDLPFILYTGKGSEAVASEAMSEGATDYLQKGSGTQQYELLANRVRNAVEQYRSQRRAAEHERITRVVRELNRALVYADSVEQIERDVCTVLCDAESYVAACIAGVDAETMRVEPRTWGGDDAGYFRELDMAIDEGSPGRQAPGGRAYHEREIAVSQEIPDDPRYEAWRDEAVKRGFRSLAVIPLDHEDDLYGLLAVFSDGPFAFDETERELLSDLGDDIAHAIHAQEIQTELQTTASWLQALFEWSPDMINAYDAEGNLIDPNPRLCERTGYDEAELTGMKVWDLDRTVEPEAVTDSWKRMDPGDSRRREGEYRRADGSTFPVKVHIRRLNLDGEERFVAISRDISDRKQRERELGRYERITENLPVGIFRSTPDGDIVSTNAQFVSLFGGESETDFADVAAQDLWVENADRENLLERLDSDGVEEELFEARTLDGESKWIRMRLRVAEEEGNRYLDGIVQDVTEKRDRRHRLEQAQTMFENAQDALFLIDVGDEFTVERVNLAYETATGFTNEDLRGQTPREILGDSTGAEIERKYQDCIDRRSSLKYEEELVIDGETTHWETRITPVVVDDEVEKIVGATRDITDRKVRERELRRNERRFEALFDDPNILVGLLETDGTILDVNSTAMEYIDAGRDDVTGDPFWNAPWWPDEMRSSVRKKVERAAKGRYVTYDAEFAGPDGDPYYLEGIIRPVTDDAGDVVSLIVSAHDVTRRAKRERRLEQYETIVETTDDIAFAVDEEWNVDFVNESVLEYVDASLDDLEGQPVMVLADEFVAGDDSPERFERALERTFRAESESEPPERLELALNMSGEEVTFEYQFSPVVSGGETTAAIITMRDVTERKAREQELQRVRERMEFALERTDSVIWVQVMETNEITTYPDPCPLTGREIETVADFRETVHPDDRAKVADAVESVLERREPDSVEHRTAADAGPEWVEVQMEPVVEDGSVSALVGISIDVTERKRRELRLERQNERFEELASAVSHDLQTPLQTARGNAELALETGDSDRMEKTLDALARTDELREDLAKILRTKEIVDETVAVDIEQVAKEARTMVDDDATLQVRDAPTVEADPGALRRLFENLLANAVEYGGEAVTVRIGRTGDGFFVADDGPGIPPADRDEVFTPGYSSNGGSGVGLASVRQTVLAHDWSIRITESEDGGARFEIDT